MLLGYYILLLPNGNHRYNIVTTVTMAMITMVTMVTTVTMTMITMVTMVTTVTMAMITMISW